MWWRSWLEYVFVESIEPLYKGVDDVLRFEYEVEVANKKVSTVVKLRTGFADGAFSDAKIGSMDDMAIDKNGIIYILDAENKAIRKVFLK